MTNILSSVIIGIVLLGSLFPTQAAATEITVDAAQSTGVVQPSIGLLHGVTYDSSKSYDRTIELLRAIKPDFWRLDNLSNNVLGFVQEGKFVQTSDTQIIFNIQIAVHNRYGFDLRIAPDCRRKESNCFRSFTELKQAWEQVTTNVLNTIVRKKAPIQYFEVFAEPKNTPFGQPDNGTGITGITPEQLGELYKMSATTIRSIKPDAKVGGPGWITFSPNLLAGFLDYVRRENVALDFVSWHEFGEPHAVLEHVKQMREFFKERPELCHPRCPEIHIGEFSPAEQLHIPGAALAWFYYLEKAKVDVSNRACWDIADPRVKWDTCWAGFNGLFLRDNTTTTPLYWVYRFYREMASSRITAKSSDPGTVVLAGRDDAARELKILIGLYGAKEGELNVLAKNYPFEAPALTAEIYRIPANGQQYQLNALKKPAKQYLGDVEIREGEVRIPLGVVQDGEVIAVVLK